MFVPEISYRYIYPKDVAGPTFEILSRLIVTSIANATATAVIQGIPKDRILVLANVSVEIVPGATQAATAARVRAFTSAAAAFLIEHNVYPATADAIEVLNWTGSIFIPGRGEDETTVEVSAFFDAGVNANVTTVGVHGIVIPRGNSAAF